MIEHRIYHHADSHSVSVRYKPAHRLTVPERRIDLCIIFRVILVVRLCLHDRSQIDSRDPEILQIGNLLPDALQISAVFLLIRHRTGLPWKYTVVFPVRRAVTEPVREDLIPDSIIDPGRRPVHIRRIHPWHDKILEQAARHINLLFREESVFKVIPYSLFRMKFKIIFTPFIRRHERRRPPDLMGKALFIDDLLPLSCPPLVSAQYPRVKRIAVDDKHSFYIVSCLQVDDQMILVQRITHLF